MKIEVKSTVTTDQGCLKLIEDMARVYLGCCYGRQVKPLLTQIFGKEKVADEVRKILEALAANTIPADPNDLVAQAEEQAAQKAADEQAGKPPPATTEAEPKKKGSKSKDKGTLPPAEQPKAGESETAQEKQPQEVPPPPVCPHCGKSRTEHKATAARAHVWQCTSPGCKMQFTTPRLHPAETEQADKPGQPDGEELVERRKAHCTKCGDELELIGYDNQDEQTGIWSCAACGDGNIRLSRYISAHEATA